MRGSDGTLAWTIITRVAWACACAVCWLAAPGPAWAQDGLQRPPPGSVLGPMLARKPGGVLGIMGYGVIPDGSASAVQVDRGVRTDDGSDSGLTLGQIGSGFTVSPSFPLFLEGYIGYARYDPRFVISGGQDARRLPLRWNNISTTIGVGWDFKLMENLYFRPIVNGALGYAASDAALLQNYANWRLGTDVDILDRGQLYAWGAGASAVLAYYDYRPARDIDVELRYTAMRLRSFGGSLQEARGQSDARALTLWTRLRWPTGLEALGRPVRWVAEATGSSYLGDQRDALGFAWMAKFGGGLELDISREEIGAFGLYASRVRLLGRYLVGDNNVRGFSVGLGISF